LNPHFFISFLRQRRIVSQTRVTILTIIETYVGIIIASLPACSVLFRRMMPRSLRSGESSSAAAAGATGRGSDERVGRASDRRMRRRLRTWLPRRRFAAVTSGIVYDYFTTCFRFG
jgi:hypothetical protein